MSAASSLGLFVCDLELSSDKLSYRTNLTSHDSFEMHSSVDPIPHRLNLTTNINQNITVNLINQSTDKNNNLMNKSTNEKKKSTKESLIPENLLIFNRQRYEKNHIEPNNTQLLEHLKMEETKNHLNLLKYFGVKNTRQEAEDTNEGYRECIFPEYIVFTWVLCLIALATGLKLYYLVKTFMAFIMVICYALLILVAFPDVFHSATKELQKVAELPLAAQMVILLVIFLTMVTYHARLVEVTSRLDFIWKEQAEKELANMKSNRFLNDVLIKVTF